MTDYDLKRLDTLADWMRARGATRVVMTDESLEMVLGPVESKPVLTPDMAVDPEHAEKRANAEYMKTLLAAVEG